jgi:hypothetical protein
MVTIWTTSKFLNFFTLDEKGRLLSGKHGAEKSGKH